MRKMSRKVAIYLQQLVAIIVMLITIVPQVDTIDIDN